MSNNIVKIEYNKDKDEYFFILPDDVMSELNWNVGDEIKWADNKDGSFTLTKEKHESN